MISVNYLNNTEQEPIIFDPLYKFEKELDNIMSEVDIAYQEYVSNKKLYELDTMFLEADKVDDKKKEKADESEKNFVSKVGSAVINMFKKAISFITEILDKLKEKFNPMKDKVSKVEAICRQNPGLEKHLTDDIKKQLEGGKLSITDLKALAELDKTYTEITNMAKKADVDPNSLKAKWEAAKTKFANADKTPIVMGAVGIATSIVAIDRANKVIQDNKRRASDNLAAYTQWEQTYGSGDVIHNDKGVFRTLADASRFMTHQYVASAQEANSVTVFFANLLDSAFNRVNPNAAKNAKNNVLAHAAQARVQGDTESSIENHRRNN